jgi:cytochrome c-type biogenesis protein CcmH
MRFCGLLAALCAAALTAGSAGASEVREFADSTQRERYEQLVRDLRCLVCQNQSLADSDADLARDLRDEVYQIIQSGKSDQEAVAFLVDRYGDFVLYRPPLKPATWLLWSGPFLLLAAGLGFIWHRTRQRARTLPSSLTPEEQARLLELKKRIQE